MRYFEIPRLLASSLPIPSTIVEKEWGKCPATCIWSINFQTLRRLLYRVANFYIKKWCKNLAKSFSGSYLMFVVAKQQRRRQVSEKTQTLWCGNYLSKKLLWNLRETYLNPIFNLQLYQQIQLVYLTTSLLSFATYLHRTPLLFLIPKLEKNAQ